MLQLQLKNLQLQCNQRTLFLIKLFFLSLCIHGCILIFIVMQGSVRRSLFVDTTCDDVSIVYSPAEVNFISLKSMDHSNTTAPIEQHPNTIENIQPTEQIAEHVLSTTITLSSEKSINQKNDRVPLNNTQEKVLSIKPPIVQKNSVIHNNQSIKTHNEAASNQNSIPLKCIATQKIQHGIAAHWQRPEGFDKNLYCIFIISWDKRGDKKITMQKSSGALAYDTQAYQALMLYDFASCNKLRSITLKM